LALMEASFWAGQRRSVASTPAQATPSLAAYLLGKGCIAVPETPLRYRFRYTFAWPEACNDELWKAANARPEQAWHNRL
jgi:hypothetical protein